MTEDIITITVDAEPGLTGSVPELAMVRLLSMLPATWDVRTQVGDSSFRLDIAAAGLRRGEVRAQLSRAFADLALGGWHWREEAG